MTWDPGVDNLQAFCTLLETTNHVLQSTTPDLDAHGKSLAEAESGLREAITALKADMEGLEKEAETSGPEAAKEATDLDGATDKLRETRIPALETLVGETKHQLHEALGVPATTLETHFAELQSRGFDATDTVLKLEQAEFERWTKESDKELESMLEGVGWAAAQVLRDDTDAVKDVAAAAQAVDHEEQELETHFNGPVSAGAKFATEVTADVLQRTEAAEKEIVEDVGFFATFLTDSKHSVETAVHGHTDETHKLVQTESAEFSQALDDAQTPLAELDTEFEQSQSDASQHLAPLAAIATLAAQVPNAQAELREMKELMDRLGQP